MSLGIQTESFTCFVERSGKVRGSIMIEAANSVALNFSTLRGNAEQVASARSYASNPEKIQEVAQAPYVSPYIYVDVDFDRAVLQIRDSDTGDVVRQFPSESELESRRRAAATQARASTDIPDPAPVAKETRKASSAHVTTTAPRAESRQKASTPATSQQIAAFTAGAQTASGGKTGTVVATEA